MGRFAYINSMQLSDSYVLVKHIALCCKSQMFSVSLKILRINPYTNFNLHHSHFHNTIKIIKHCNSVLGLKTTRINGLAFYF